MALRNDYAVFFKIR